MHEERSYGLETIPTWTLFFLASSFAAHILAATVQCLQDADDDALQQACYLQGLWRLNSAPALVFTQRHPAFSIALHAVETVAGMLQLR